MCTLKIYSNTRSFLQFAEKTKLPCGGCQIMGELRLGRANETYKSHRIALAASDKDWDDFKGQVLDVISFLTENEQELSNLIQTHEVVDAYLDFPLYSRLDGNVVNQNDHLPRELVVLAGRIGLGIEMAIYEKEAIDEVVNGN